MANIAFSQSPAFSGRSGAVSESSAPSAEELATRFDQPPASPDQMDRMSVEDTIAKTFGAFVVLVLGSLVGWFMPMLLIPAAIAGFVLALVNIFKKQPSAGLVLAFAVAEGIFVGAVSRAYATMWDGIIPMALFGTLGVVAVVLALFTSGKVRATPRATRIFLVLLVGYAAFSLVNFMLMLFGVTDSMYGLRGAEIMGIPLGVPLGILAVALGSYSLVLDFENIKDGVERGLPRRFGWTGAFGIVLTVVWLYLEILRLLSFFLPRN